MTIKVLIADDHKLFRQGLIGLMKTREDLVNVIGEAETGEEALQLAGELSPDVILMDIYMPQMDGLQAAKEIHIRFPKIAIRSEKRKQATKRFNWPASCPRMLS